MWEEGGHGTTLFSVLFFAHPSRRPQGCPADGDVIVCPLQVNAFSWVLISLKL